MLPYCNIYRKATNNILGAVNSILIVLLFYCQSVIRTSCLVTGWSQEEDAAT